MSPASIRGLVLAATAAALALHILPGAPAALALDWRAVATGAWWQLATGHLVHWSAEHLLWDAAVFAALGWACAGRAPVRTVVALALGLPLVAFAVRLGAPELATYRGLSGLDTALFALLVADLVRAAWSGRARGPATALGLACTAALAVKLGVEAGGATLFVRGGGTDFVPVPAAHLGGAVAGLLAGLLPAPARWGRPSLAARPSARKGAIRRPAPNAAHSDGRDPTRRRGSRQRSCIGARPRGPELPGPRRSLQERRAREPVAWSQRVPRRTPARRSRTAGPKGR